MTTVTKFDVKITLTVSAKYLFDNGSASGVNTSNVDQLCLLSDDRIGKYDSPAKNENFRSEVYKSKNVLWTGKSLDPSYLIKIDDYVAKSGTSAVVDINTKTEVGFSVVYKVLDEASEDDETYKIIFSIKHANTLKQFSLDPILKANP